MVPFLAGDSIPHPLHFAFAVYFALFFVAASFFFDKFVFTKLATWLLSRGSAHIKLNEVTQAKIVKCSESMWKLTYYATVESCILQITYHESWFRNAKEYFKGWPNQELMLSLKLYYMCQCGFYLYSIAALLVWETRREDFAVMMSHHVITVILIGYSYIARLQLKHYEKGDQLNGQKNADWKSSQGGLLMIVFVYTFQIGSSRLGSGHFSTWVWVG